MNFINGHSNKTDRPLYNSRLIRNYLEYVNKHHPEVDVESVLKYAEMAKYEVEDPAYWFTQTQIERFHDILVEKTGDSKISRSRSVCSFLRSSWYTQTVCDGIYDP